MHKLTFFLYKHTVCYIHIVNNKIGFYNESYAFGVQNNNVAVMRAYDGKVAIKRMWLDALCIYIIGDNLSYIIKLLYDYHHAGRVASRSVETLM